MDPVECSHQGLLAYKDGALGDAIVLFSRRIDHPHSSLMTGAPIISRSGFGTD